MATLETSKRALTVMPRKVAAWLDEADNKMRDTSELVYKNFQAIEEAINKKEEEMLMCLEKCAADLDSTRRLIGNARDLACEIPAILEDGKALLEKEEEKKKRKKKRKLMKKKASSTSRRKPSRVRTSSRNWLSSRSAMCMPTLRGS